MAFKVSDFFPTAGLVPPPYDVAEDFHELTKSTPEKDYLYAENVYQYLFQLRGKVETQANKKNYFGMPSIGLPAPRVSARPFGAVVEARCSTRAFSQESMTLQQVSDVLSALRVNRTSMLDEEAGLELKLRPYPSPGGLYPSEIYVVFHNVAGQDRIVGRYDPEMHRLTVIRRTSPEAIEAATCAKRTGIDSPPGVYICVTSLFERAIVKYGCLGYRFALMESGIILQQLSLAATAHDLASLVWGGYFDDELNALLGVSPATETATGCLFLGMARPDAA